METQSQFFSCNLFKIINQCFCFPLYQEVGAKKDRLDFEQFHKLYNHIMFEQNEVSVAVRQSFRKKYKQNV